MNVSIDFSGLAQLIVDALVAGLQKLFTPLPHDFEVWVLQSIQGMLSAQGAHNMLTHTPLEWTSQNHDVLDLWRQGLVVEGGLAAIAICIGGYRVMAGKADMWQVLFRTGFLVIAGMSMAFWSDRILALINVASDGIGSSPLDIRAESLPADLTVGLTLIVAAILALFAWLKGVVGTLFLAVLIVAAPYMLTLSAIPMLEGLGKWWAEEFTTWALRPFMVALVLRLGLGLAIVNTGGTQFLFACVAFWLAYTMDTKLRRFSVGAWGSLSNMNLLNRGARMAASAFSGGAAGAPAAVAAAGAAVVP